MKRTAEPANSESGITRDAKVRAIVLRPVSLAQAASQIAEGPLRVPELGLAEAVGLAEALELEVVHGELAPVRQISPRTFFGAGRVDRLKDEVADAEADVVIIDGALSPGQQRNLEKAVNAKIVDRTGLILEIFGLRAQTREGRLQVELARQAYERSRLVRTWTHLERQRGGLGKTGGPGETQIELDRRQIADRITRLKRELEDVRRTRGLQRRARARAGMPAIVLVGYTNAGKSSLFNRLTEAGVFAKDMPFATLDPTARQITLPSGRAAILSDTVGFISNLPTELIASFRATLEAVTEADLLLHVRDMAHPETEAQRADVLSVLEQLNREAGRDAAHSAPMLEVWNKIDLLDDVTRESLVRRAQAQSAATDSAASMAPVAISATSGEGMDDLLAAIDRAAFSATRIVSIAIPVADGKTRARIAAAGRILEEAADEDGVLTLTAELSVEDAARFAPYEAPAPPVGRAAE